MHLQPYLKIIVKITIKLQNEAHLSCDASGIILMSECRAADASQAKRLQISFLAQLQYCHG